MPPPPPVLMEELVEEILLRLPPGDPASLFRAALVCKPWRRLVTDPRFRRRFREHHRAPPLLGFLCNNYGPRRTHRVPYVSRFVPTSSFLVPPDRAVDRDWRALEARHGRVLLRFRTMRTWGPVNLVVWDPVMDERRKLPDMRGQSGHWNCNSWNVAVLCARGGAAAAADSACDHLDCCGGPFIVVSLYTYDKVMYLCVYSSEDGSWSEPARVSTSAFADHVDIQPTALAGNTLYFQIDYGTRILGYDLDTRETYVVDLPPMEEHEDRSPALMTVENGGLGVAILGDLAMLSLWSMEASPNGGMGWTKSRVIDLEKLLSVDAQSSIYAYFVAFAHGIGMLIVETGDGLFSFHLASGQVKKVLEAEACYEDYGICGVVPYMSFCTPALGGVSTGDGSSGASSPGPRGSGVAHGGDEDEHSHDHGNDNEATTSDEDDDDCEATSNGDDDDDSEAMSSSEDDEDGDGDDNCAYLISLLLLALDATEGELP